MVRKTCISRPLAPEDIRIGDFVSPLSVLIEERTFLPTADEPLVGRAQMLPDDEQLRVARVVSVCLPFVLVEGPDAAARLVDVRRHRLARLAAEFGRQVFARLRTTPPAPATQPASDNVGANT